MPSCPIQASFSASQAMNVALQRKRWRRLVKEITTLLDHRDKVARLTSPAVSKAWSRRRGLDILNTLGCFKKSAKTSDEHLDQLRRFEVNY